MDGYPNIFDAIAIDDQAFFALLISDSGKIQDQALITNDDVSGRADWRGKIDGNVHLALRGVGANGFKMDRRIHRRLLRSRQYRKHWQNENRKFHSLDRKCGRNTAAPSRPYGWHE